MEFTRINAIISLLKGTNYHIDKDHNIDYQSGQTPLTEVEINAEIIRLQAEYDAQEYARNRELEYPDIKEQLDYIYHNGLTKWKSDMIKPVKDKYPK